MPESPYYSPPDDIASQAAVLSGAVTGRAEDTAALPANEEVGDLIRSLISRWQDRRAARSIDAIAPVLSQVSQSRWQRMEDAIGPRVYRILEVKWRFPPGWDGGNGYPPRPRSAQELADELGWDVKRAREMDWELVDMFRDARRHDPYFPSFLTVPIDAAQEWWDREHGWLFTPDRREKPQRERGNPPVGPPPPPDTHDMEDQRELREHMRGDHGHDYADESWNYIAEHRIAHRDEAQDREWDRRFRSRSDGSG
jgi:hypothetical protein